MTITGTNIQKQTFLGKYRGTTFSKHDVTLVAKVFTRECLNNESLCEKTKETPDLVMDMGVGYTGSCRQCIVC